MFKSIRIFILATILCLIGVNAWLTQVRSTDWNAPLSVVVYPIAGDNSNKIYRYLNNLLATHFESLETFLAKQAKQYGVTLNQPVYFTVAEPLGELPPQLPDGRNAISAILWSLTFRYWAWRMKKSTGQAGADIPFICCLS